MQQSKLLCAAILLTTSLAWIGCDDRGSRSTSPGSGASGERGAPGSPQGPSGPSDAQKKQP